jgi:sensor histidine kinase regulating citrate/malate metabolism
LSLASQLLLLQLVVLACVLAVVGVISVRQSTAVFEEQRGTQLRSVAEYLANVPVVRAQVDGDDAARALAPPVTRAFALSAADRVSIAAPDGTTLASSDSATNGEPAALGDSRVGEGRGWSGEVDTDQGRVLAAHAPILTDDGRLVGFAIAEADYPSVAERLGLAAPDLLLYLGLGALLGLVGSLLLSRLTWRRTRGLRSSEIATLADHREALLVSIGEGVIAVGTDGRVTTVNDSARSLLRLGPDVVGRHVSDLGLGAEVEELLLAEEESHDAVLLVGDRVLVLNQRAAASRGEGIGTVTTLRDRTELVAVQNQLSSNLSITDTLRAQTHEFANKLHTISGLVQLGEYDEVVTLIGDLTRQRRELAEHVSGRIADLPLAALVVAKTSVAAEAGVDLRLADDSGIPALPADVSSDLVTVVGNLVDNAVDACRGGGSPRVELSMSVETAAVPATGEAAGERAGAAADEAGAAQVVVVEVRDDGPGIPDGSQEAIFVRGFTTKAEVPGGRGLGLALVRMVCVQRGGSVTTYRAGGRTVFRVTVPLARVPTGSDA